jgi:hypothetical protein
LNHTPITAVGAHSIAAASRSLCDVVLRAFAAPRQGEVGRVTAYTLLALGSLHPRKHLGLSPVEM